jgi:hypothetical protein
MDDISDGNARDESKGLHERLAAKREDTHTDPIDAPSTAGVEAAAPSDRAAKNDERFELGSETGEGLLESLLRAADAPPDRPDEANVLEAATFTVERLQSLVDGSSRLAARLRVMAASHESAQTPGTTTVTDSKRIGKHLMYWLLRELATRIGHGEPLDDVMLQIVGAWLVHGLLTGWQPRSKVLAKVRSAAVRPDGAHARNWSSRARELVLLLALRGLNRAIESAPNKAKALGLKPPERREEPAEQSEWATFNRLFRRRVNNLRTLSALHATTGTLGHGTLSTGGLAAAGVELLAGVQAQDDDDLLVYLECLTHLPCETALEVPVVVSGAPPADALAWIDLSQKQYAYRLVRLLERGAKPRADQLARLESSTQVVAIGLSPPAANLLELRAREVSEAVVPLKRLLPSAGHHPRATVAGGTGYKTTARRMQETLPALLLQQGHFRWPVLLATNSPYLVSAGRDSYGLCRSGTVDLCVVAIHRALKWPLPRRQTSAALVGSRTVPRAEAITALLDHLAAMAEAEWRGLETGDSAVASLRACAPWISGVLSLNLALRTRLEYRVPSRPLLAGDRVRFNDKHAEGMEPVALPICPTLARIYAAWAAVARTAGEVLSRSSYDRDRQLGLQVVSTLDDPASTLAAFSVDKAGRLIPVGYRTWHDTAARKLRLPGNFARQFWPLQLMDLQIEQRLLDVLMRHQLGGHDLRMAWGTNIPLLAFERLRAAIELVVQRLAFRVPTFLEAQP